MIQYVHRAELRCHLFEIVERRVRVVVVTSHAKYATLRLGVTRNRREWTSAPSAGLGLLLASLVVFGLDLETGVVEARRRHHIVVCNSSPWVSKEGLEGLVDLFVGELFWSRKLLGLLVFRRSWAVHLGHFLGLTQNTAVGLTVRTVRNLLSGLSLKEASVHAVNPALPTWVPSNSQVWNLFDVQFSNWSQQIL